MYIKSCSNNNNNFIMWLVIFGGLVLIIRFITGLRSPYIYNTYEN